ncbi:MAG: DUF3120 domain-containing protein [Symploca sp. SIO3C6]|uniref:DUF3120 domain-containing protein n=1 Tax=Symploca sp. SIO1C4 TaxID=2607765 RepID=A0A6B3NRZ5_9CYAN|nr:DUF3120 domain-containing protein [Symploca sp. SIO3C6]NER31968.1 DUF3120 domain-containing protein [Symploca sp. SIO1C4]NET03592.1 DUF3120 domain-containing protein [Symploca sp. SIO2B6]NET51870.1 DUF3120 domain-containing protein [Merismopedia sp. SIO2A8]
MLNNTWFSPDSASGLSNQSKKFWLYERVRDIGNRQTWSVFWASSFLVSVPVFVQAPLVRELPFLSLVMTLGWVWLGLRLFKGKETKIWGDLLLGFSWSWLAGSIYWGWLRWEPLIHLPIEAIGLPFALWGWWRGWGMVGNLFYLGSLLGTALTDVYFYLTALIPYWRQLMQVEPQLAGSILQSALVQVQTPWGISWAGVLVSTLMFVGIGSLARGGLHWWAFSGAVLSTILVDGLFWLVASLV